MKNYLFTAVLAFMAVTLHAQNDWANFGKYEQNNREVMATTNDGRRVVFLGNSITENWRKMRPEFFTGHGFIARGISGQTSYQMLLRFREDVIALSPKVVVINAGTNDIAQNNHPYVEDRTFGNIVSMCEIAKANGIKPVLCTATPADGIPWRPEVTAVVEQVKELNRRITEYAKAKKYPLVDYWTALADKGGGFPRNLAPDGIHPNVDGYLIMEELLLKKLK